MRPIFMVAVLAALAANAPAQKTNADLDKQELKMIAGLTAKTKAARVAYFKKPKDAKIKLAFVTAANKEAEAILVSPALEPKDKYPRSLRLYREIVRVDPKHKNAIKRIDLIESIYKSLGKPIPK